jgi:hypothetical protein
MRKFRSFSGLIIDFTLNKDLSKCFIMQRLFLFSEIIYKNMAFCCGANPHSRSSTPRSPTRDQSPRDFAVRGKKIKPSSTKDSKSKIAKTVSFIIEDKMTSIAYSL